MGSKLPILPTDNDVMVQKGRGLDFFYFFLAKTGFAAIMPSIMSRNVTFCFQSGGVLGLLLLRL